MALIEFEPKPYWCCPNPNLWPWNPKSI